MKPICVDQPAEFGAIRRDHNGAEVVVYDCGEARRTKDAPHLSERAHLVANVHQHSVRVDHIERPSANGSSYTDDVKNSTFSTTRSAADRGPP